MINFLDLQMIIVLYQHGYYEAEFVNEFTSKNRQTIKIPTTSPPFAVYITSCVLRSRIKAGYQYFFMSDFFRNPEELIQVLKRFK